MGAILSLPFTLLNFLLPFTRPGTPIVQDLIHTIVLCGTLYFAPQIAEWYNTRQLRNTAAGVGQGQDELQDQGQEPQQAQPHDTRGAPQLPQAHHQPAFQPQLEDELEPDAPQPGPAEPQQLVPPAFEPAEGEAGPANAEANERPRPTPANRAIGAKKAKSLARKDQRRAYHEFHRQEAELRRLQEAEGRDEREAALAAEKARRAAAEAEIREQERKEREEAKALREREQQEEQERRERCVQHVRQQLEDRGAVDLAEAAYAEGKDQLWVERLVRASGLLAQAERQGGKVLITSRGWLVRVDKEIMEMAYKEAEEAGDRWEGKVDFGEFGEMLERAVRARGGF
ncbi:hypothetical protein E8E12_007794 [Didymella heteroderae]|uniref:Uncharacterized protein n=1 Tax=Didymella heteroderae TaxID=1769908 RepID=A0A9P4WQ89_9PLEO|nr:hypothetical protein E8E12_007794 [Didymella heteroderae]